MKAMVLAAGYGSRLEPLTLQRAKPALRLVDRSVCNHILHWLRGFGVNEAVINLHHLPESVRRTVRDGGPAGLRIHWSEESEILGTGGGLKAAEAWFRGEETFLLVNGDCWFGLDLRPVLDAHASARPVATLALLPMPKDERYASVDTDHSGRVRRIAGLPESASDADLRPMHYPGVMLLTPHVLDALPAVGFCDIHRDGLVPLIEAGETALGVECTGSWHDIGTPRRFLAATREILDSRGRGSWSAASAETADDAQIDRHSVLGDGARVEAGAVIERSVLLDGAVVRAGAAVCDAILGYGTWLEPGRTLEGRVRVETEGGIREAPVDPHRS